MSEPTCNFYSEYKLHECCVRDAKSPCKDLIHFEGGYAYASDGIVAVRAKIDHISNFPPYMIDMLEGKSINSASFKKLLTYDDVIVKEEGFEVVSDTTPAFFGFDRQKEIKFPDANTIFDVAHTALRLKTNSAIAEIGLNLTRLRKIAAAMNADRLRFDFNGTKGILVRNNEPDSWITAEGILMPISVTTNGTKEV